MLEDSLNFSGFLVKKKIGFPLLPKLKRRKELEFLNNSYFRKNIFRVVNQEMRWEANSPPFRFLHKRIIFLKTI